MVINVHGQEVHFNPADVLNVPHQEKIWIEDPMTLALDNSGSPILAIYGSSRNYNIPVEINSTCETFANIFLTRSRFRPNVDNYAQN